MITPKVFVKIAKIVKDGKFKKQIYTFNMLTDEAITLTYNPKTKAKIPQKVIDAINSTKAKILSGKFEVPQIDFTAEN